MEENKGFYNFNEIEKKWQTFWETKKTFAANDNDPRPKYYVLDMFPYPSAQGLHVGHPEGYTASDIVARFKRMKGFNVLHPIGWDAFGLPAEQYAVKTGTHPAITTQQNIDNMRRQIKALGFSYDWDRQVDTTDPGYYKWTQWIFLKLFNSYFDTAEQKAKPISELITKLQEGDLFIGPDGLPVSANPIPAIMGIPVGTRKWIELTEVEKEEFLNNQRLAYEDEVAVNWCPELGTVLANEEVIGGISERGGHPVIRKPMRQWMLRITKYADRLEEDLQFVDWPQSIKKLQTDWIGKSIGAEVDFKVDGFDEIITVFTTRPDTLFGATYMVLAPEHPIVDEITSPGQKQAIEDYKKIAQSKSDLDRTDLAKDKSGVFTGAYAINPVNNEKIQIWISDYVLISYGTGAIMSVPAHDERDFEFANKHGLEIRPVVEPDRKTALTLPIPTSYSYEGPTEGIVSPQEWIAIADSIIAEVKNGQAPFTRPVPTKLEKRAIELVKNDSLAVDEIRNRLKDIVLTSQCTAGEGIAINSGEFTGLPTADFKEKITNWLDEKGLGKKAVNYKLRDWLFSRQRYWGEPFPLLHLEDGQIIALDENDLPLTLPETDNFKPSDSGQSPLAKIENWLNIELPNGQKAKRETNTMPQWAGSCWYYLRYLDPKNDRAAWEKEKEKYWMPVDLYIGGAEHAVLHLLYSRFWHKLLFDLGYVSTPEPFKKLINQGMILGEDNQKMSKSRGNVVNPDKVITDYGADSMRLYEMFMGPLESTKPWSMQGVEGVHRFLNKLWRAVIDEQTGLLHSSIKDVDADEETLRILHQTIRKVTQNVETFRFNTAISQMMIFVNHLMKLESRPKKAIETFILILSPFAPHIAEELWQLLGNKNTLVYENWPQFDENLAKEKEIELAVQVLGKIKDKIVVPFDADEEEIKQKALACEKVASSIAGKEIKKIIVIKSRLVNIVI
ncbi:MAG: leucine--tRNA ligase [Planctomycetes bacterium GWF2_41_51]|nr:MAG: leucine--tRNA ligase [Planctomycetes bacterium GWF2_41_51]